MNLESSNSRPAVANPLLARRFGSIGDSAFRYITMAFGMLTVLTLSWIAWGLWHQSLITRRMFGWSILTSSEWDVGRQLYGALPYIYGTLVTSALALVIAVPIGIGAALFLTDVAPRWLAAPISFLIELLAAVPSVIYGLWGFLVLCPWLNEHLYPVLTNRFGSIPLFAGPAFMTNLFSAGLILAIMILPFITAVTRDVIRTVPESQREASLGLGATRWETISAVVLKGARSGIVGAVILGLGRAIGETMAVVMVIGNNPQISASLMQPGYTMPGLLANQFNEAYTDDVQRSALLEVAFILFVVTLIMNGLARLLILWMNPTPRADRGRGRGAAALTAAGQFARPAGLTLAAGIAAWLVLGDLRRRGIAGLAGPLEAALLLFGLLRLVTAWSRGKRAWLLWRKANNLLMHSVITACASAACFVLFLLLSYVAVQGAKSLNLHFFTSLPGSPDDPNGGMKNGILGTLELVAIAATLAVPTGLLGGIFLAEFGRGRLGGVIRLAADALAGIPSVVIGMFAYAAFVLPVKHFSAAAGGAALGIMMLPTIIRTTEEMISRVPMSLREASLGLGATHVRTVASIILPAARSGVITGILLALARVAGETAPLLFTAFGNDLVSTKLSEPISSLTMMIYRYATSAYPSWIAQAWAGALTLLVLVLVISVMARIATRNRYALR